MALITPPARIPVQNDSWKLLTPSQSNRNWSGKQRVRLLPGARWTCELSLRPLLMGASASQAKPWRGFFASLEGMAHTFPVYPEPVAQNTLGNGTVNGANQTGSALNVNGLAAYNGTKAVDAGDWIAVVLPTAGQQLLMVTSSTTVASGACTINFKPILRESPANGAAVLINDPYAIMSLTSQEAGWSRDVMRVHNFVMSAEETW